MTSGSRIKVLVRTRPTAHSASGIDVAHDRKVRTLCTPQPTVGLLGDGCGGVHAVRGHLRRRRWHAAVLSLCLSTQAENGYVQGLTIRLPKRGGCAAADHRFDFERVLHHCSQEDVYEARVAEGHVQLTLQVLRVAKCGTGARPPCSALIIFKGSHTGAVQACAVEALQSVLNGYNAAILAYGQTGAGKTFTMSGAGQGFGQHLHLWDG